ncbi:LysM domain-containing protein [Fusarium sp. LHS14.1]|nr:LysM domain-containing protein [Fusarium sp. LHS14.1]
MASKFRFFALLQLVSCYRLFDSPFELPDYVPEICREALSGDIDCPSSLDGFLDNVVVACGDFKDGLWENISESRSTMEFAESILWARDLFCLEEKKLHSTHDSRLSTNTPNVCEGTIYTVQKGDTCESISKAVSVATGKLIEGNGLTNTCSDLLEGRNICIEDTCEIMRIELGQTCQDFVKWKWFSTIQLQLWNPTLKPLCNSRLIPNLDAVACRYVCIGPPGEPNGPQPSPTQLVKGKWRMQALVSSKPSKTTMNSAPVTITEPLEPYKTRLPKIDVSPDAANSKAEFLKYCWLANETWDYILDSDGPSEDCQNPMDIYCTFHPERPSLTVPSSIPETCTPDSDVDEL